MSRYSIERGEWALLRMMPPGNLTVSELAEEIGISVSAMRPDAWGKQARAAGAAVPGDGKSPGGWPSQEKFPFALSESELSSEALFQNSFAVSRSGFSSAAI